MKCCPTCGQTLPPATPKGLVLKRGHLKIYEAVRKAGKHGILTTDLLDKVYGDDPNGGPDDAYNTLACRIVYLNKILTKFKQRIASDRGRGSGLYTLRNL